MIATSFIWKRPNLNQFPRVWSTFTGPGDNGVEYEIRDLIESEFNDAINLMKTSFLRDEPVAESLNLLSEPDSVEVYEYLWESAIKQEISIGCFNKETGELAGVNLLVVHSKSDVNDDKVVGGPALQMNLKIIDLCFDAFDVYKNLKTAHFLSAYGLGVSDAYRKQGIATELLKARFPVMKEFSIPHTCTFFSGPGSQKAAEKAGFSSHYELMYDDVIKLGYPLHGIKAKSAKLMSAPCPSF